MVRVPTVRSCSRAMAAICLIVLALEIGFLAAAMPPGPVLEPLDQGVIDAAPQPVRHGTLDSLIAMLSVWLGGAAAVAIFHAPYGCFRACSRVL